MLFIIFLTEKNSKYSRRCDMQCGYLDVTAFSINTAPCYKEKENNQFGVVCVDKGIKIKLLNKHDQDNIRKHAEVLMNLTRQFEQSILKGPIKICFQFQPALTVFYHLGCALFLKEAVILYFVVSAVGLKPITFVNHTIQTW